MQQFILDFFRKSLGFSNH